MGRYRHVKRQVGDVPLPTVMRNALKEMLGTPSGDTAPVRRHPEDIPAPTVQEKAIKGQTRWGQGDPLGDGLGTPGDITNA